MEGTDGQVQVHINALPPPISSLYDYKLILFPGEPEGVPRAVLHHLYTGDLPTDTEQLIWVSTGAQHAPITTHRY